MFNDYKVKKREKIIENKMPEYPRTRNMCVQVMTIEQETITTICVQCHGTWFVYTADSTAN